MVDQDMVFRAGLLLAVLALAGIFGTSIGSKIKYDSDSNLDEVSSILEDLIETIHSSEPGSSLKITFGRSNDVVPTMISLPEKIGGRNFNLNFLNGLVWIGFNDDKEIVIEGDWILPSYVPLNDPSFLGDMSARFASMSDGYQVRTPCSIVIEKPKGTMSDEVFIFPGKIQEDAVIGDMGSAISLFDDPGQLLPGWSRTANISGEDLLYVDDQVILIQPRGVYCSSGTCPIPLILQGNVEVIDDGDRVGSLVVKLMITKEALTRQDGTLELSTRINIEHSSDPSL